MIILESLLVFFLVLIFFAGLRLSFMIHKKLDLQFLNLKIFSFELRSKTIVFIGERYAFF